MKVDKDNTNEVKITELVSNMVLKDIMPHFPINYRTFICNNIEDRNNKDFPEKIRKHKYYIFLNELAKGDLKSFMTSGEPYKSKYYVNALAQIFIAILSFHNLGYYHDDCHYGNFLYHRIPPGGYFQYSMTNNEKVYIENLGYLWVIWDFGKSFPIDSDDFIFFKSMVDDKLKNFEFFRIIQAFLNESDKLYIKENEESTITDTTFKGWIDDKYPIPYNTKKTVKSILKSLERIFIDYGGDERDFYSQDIEHTFFEDLIKNTNLFIKEKDLPPNAEIINSNIYEPFHTYQYNDLISDNYSSYSPKSPSSQHVAPTATTYKPAIYVKSVSPYKESPDHTGGRSYNKTKKISSSLF